MIVLRIIGSYVVLYVNYDLCVFLFLFVRDFRVDSISKNNENNGF